jgi:hypothetical protein
MFKPGDVVYIEDSAGEDVAGHAWPHIETWREAVVRGIAPFSYGREALPESEVVYALEWPEEFSGGHTCQNMCEGRRGHFVSGKHLTLQFEKSRQVSTVPNIVNAPYHKLIYEEGTLQNQIKR